MKRLSWMLLFVVAILAVGCGSKTETKTETVTVYTEHQPSIAISTPTTGTQWIIGNRYRIEWSGWVDPNYFQNYWVSFYLIPQGNTPLKQYSGSGVWIDQYNGGYYISGYNRSVDDINDKMLPADCNVPVDLPAGRYRLQVLLRSTAHNSEGITETKIVVAGTSDEFSIISNPIISTTDDDGSIDYSQINPADISPYNSDFYVAGTTQGIYIQNTDATGKHFIFGLASNPTETTDLYDTFHDFCDADGITLNEGFRRRYDGKMDSAKTTCPAGCSAGACIPISYNGGRG